MKEQNLEETLADELPEKVVERLLNTTHLGDIPNPDGYAHVQGDCGDSMEVFLSIEDRRVREARFDTLGCGYTIACGSAAMEIAEGKMISEALNLKAQEISEALGGLPASHLHCAELAVTAIRKAAQDYLFRNQEPWKKLYRR